jgi:flagellar basal body-associated protein FliL
MTVSADERDSTKAVPRKRRRRQKLIVLAIVLVFLSIAYLGVCRFLTHKLEATVAAKLDAELKVDRLLYLPPYGLRMSGAHLNAQEQRAPRRWPGESQPRAESVPQGAAADRAIRRGPGRQYV